jgi:hypothetical protein
MSRRQVAPGIYVDEGPSGYRSEFSAIHGSLVVGGKVKGPSPTIYPTPLTGEALADAKRRYIGTVQGSNR